MYGREDWGLKEVYCPICKNKLDAPKDYGWNGSVKYGFGKSVVENLYW